jgi:predicted Zn-dependent protease
VSELHRQLEQLLEQRRTRVAKGVLEQAFAKDPNDPENHYFAARVAEIEGDLATAKGHVFELLAGRPHHVAGRSLAIEIARKSKDYTLAEEYALGLIRDNPADGHFYAQYAFVMLETLHVDKARGLIREALRISPDDQLARVLDVLASIIAGERRRAREGLTELCRTNPDALSVAWTIIAVLQAEHRDAEALEVAKEVVRADPGDVDAVNAVIELRAQTHLLALPAWPLRRFGWGGSIGLWVFAVIALQAASRTNNVALAAGLGGAWVLYAVYSWTYLPLLRRWIRARGV